MIGRGRGGSNLYRSALRAAAASSREILASNTTKEVNWSFGRGSQLFEICLMSKVGGNRMKMTIGVAGVLFACWGMAAPAQAEEITMPAGTERF